MSNFVTYKFQVYLIITQKHTFTADNTAIIRN